MTVEKLISSLLAKKGKAAVVAALASVEPPPASKETEKEVKKYIKILGSHLQAGRRRKAIATALALMIIDAEYTIPRLRRAGMLRTSRYNFQAASVAAIVNTVLQIRHLLNARPDRFTYLESVLALTRLAPNVRELHDGILAFLRSRKDEVLKTLLVLVNSRFYFGWPGLHDESPLDPRHYTAEEFSEAVSLLFSMYRGLFKLTDDCCNLIDEKAIKSKNPVYDGLFLAAVHIVKFKEAESLIDGLPYQASLSERIVTVSSIDPDIEKSVRLGFIQSQNQVAIRALKLSRDNVPPSIKEFVERGFSKGLESAIEVVDHPVRRLRFMMPSAPKIFNVFSSDKLFRDEIESFLVLDIDNFGKKDDLLFNITARISSLDIIKFQRYFRFISCVYQKKLEEFTDEAERQLLTFRSTVFVMPRDQLLDQINLIFSDYEKTKELIDLLTLDENRVHVDLQYSPFIVIGHHYVVAPHIVAASNLVRNIIYANNLRPALIGPSDPMQQAIIKALEDAGFKVRAEAKPKIGGRELETDIFAWRDNVLFMFECKNAYHPCSTHEMRTSFDHIKTARKQLDVRLDVFRDPANQKILFRKLDWNMAPTNEIYTGILIANRVFHGARLNGHPVRQAHEFINVVLRGEIVGTEGKLSFWTGPQFQTSDLVSYLKGGSVMADQLSALQPYTNQIQLGSRTLSFLTYRLDPDVLAQHMKTKYQACAGPNASP